MIRNRLTVTIRRAHPARFAAAVALSVGGFVAVGVATAPSASTTGATLFWPPSGGGVTTVANLPVDLPVVGQG